MNNELIAEIENKTDSSEGILDNEIKSVEVSSDHIKTDIALDKDLNENSELADEVKENESVSEVEGNEPKDADKSLEDVNQDGVRDTESIHDKGETNLEENSKESSFSDNDTEVESHTLEKVKNYDKNLDVSQIVEKINVHDEEKPVEPVHIDQNSSESGSSIECIESESKSDVIYEPCHNPVQETQEIVEDFNDDKEIEDADITVIEKDETAKEILLEQDIAIEVQENEKNEKIKENLDNQEKEEEWSDVIGSGNLMKRIIKKGSGNKPVTGQSVVVDLEMYEKESEKLIERLSNLKFVIGDCDVFRALDTLACSMLVGEEAEVLTNSILCDLNSADNQQSNELNIKLKVNLLANDGHPDYSKVTAKEKYSIGNAKRERGNTFYSKSRYNEAIFCYTKALNVLNTTGGSSEDTNSDLQALVEIKMKCYSNLAAAQLKIKQYEDAEQACTAALSIQPNNVKALFRKAKAIMGKGAGDLDLAAQLMKKAIQIDPSEKAIQSELQKLMARIVKQNKSQKEIYQRMFNGKEKGSDKEKTSLLNQTWLWLTGGALAGALISMIVYKRLHS